MAAQKHFSQDDNITKEHSLKHYKIHARTFSLEAKQPREREYRQCVKQQDDRSNASESVAVSDVWNEPGSLYVIQNVVVLKKSFSLTKFVCDRIRKNLHMIRT